VKTYDFQRRPPQTGLARLRAPPGSRREPAWVPGTRKALSEKRGRYQAMLVQFERTGEDQISLTDPDSRAMAAHTKVAVGYNIQVAVDAKHKLIVEQAVTNQVVDMGLLTRRPRSRPVKS
jgi:hypothetical protein